MPKLYWYAYDAYPVFGLSTNKDDGYRFYDEDPPPPIELSTEEQKRFRRVENEWNEFQKLIADRAGWADRVVG